MAKIRKILDESEVLVIRMECSSAIQRLTTITKELMESDPETSLELVSILSNLHIVSRFLEEKCTSERKEQGI